MNESHPLREAAEAATAGEASAKLREAWVRVQQFKGKRAPGGAPIEAIWDALNAIPAALYHLDRMPEFEADTQAEALLDENAGLRAALEGALLVLELSEHQSREDPTFGAEVRALGERIGFGALMTSASASWAKYAQGAGHPGSEFVVGPCRSTLTKALALIRLALKDSSHER